MLWKGGTTILHTIHSPADLKKIPKSHLHRLAREIRAVILETVSKNGGHLASNLGAVELTIALHRVFDSPSDAIIWDVSHQCYAHKLLTGRYNQFQTLRKKNGISGFTRANESEHDFFSVGHASTSISSALGLLVARSLQNDTGKVVAVIGDGALTGGMAFEALSHAGLLSKNLIVVLNDNQMSIDHNTGSISRYLSRITMSAQYQTIRYKIDRLIDKIPFINKYVEKFAFRFKRAVKGMFLTNNLFVDLGFEYAGPLNGHDISSLESIFERVKKLSRPVVVHVVTKKGKGYNFAETNPENFHGVSPFFIETGKSKNKSAFSFTDAFEKSILHFAENNSSIVAITAAMTKGCGLLPFSQKYPNRFFDVGIAESHAVTFAGALAKGGLLPIVCIYSTFIQRAIDQIIHDVSLQNSHVIFMLDRAGAVPGDGETHQGLFDIALIRSVPGAKILSPASEMDLHLCLEYAIKNDGIFFIRYPKAPCPKELDDFSLPVKEGEGVLLKCENFAPTLLPNEKNAKRVLLVCTGGMYQESLSAARLILMKNFFADIYTMRFVFPVDEKHFVLLSQKYDAVVLIEDGVERGGASEMLEALLLTNLQNMKNTNLKVAKKTFPNAFFSHGSREDVLEEAGMSSSCIASFAISLLEEM